MTMHYIIQGIFVIIGSLSVLASIFNWDWFFTAQNTQFIVYNVGRKRARLCYAALGILMIATACYFFMEAQATINKKKKRQCRFFFYSSSKVSAYSISP